LRVRHGHVWLIVEGGRTLRATEEGVRDTPWQRLLRRATELLRAEWPCLALIVVFWAIRYWNASRFGLYEDDLTHLPTAFQMSLRQAVAYALDPTRFINFYGQGHPLSFSFIYLLSNLGWRLGGMQGPYWFGFGIEAVNIVLFYALLRRIHSRELAIVGGIAYVLYSADTTQAFLTHSLGLQPTLTFLLLAGHAYLSGWYIAAYVLAGLMLITYETAYTVFFAFPLLSPDPRRRRLSSLVRHCLILVVILGVVSVLRAFAGENRVTDLQWPQIVSVPLVHMIEGPLVSLATYAYRPLQALLAVRLDVVLATVAAIVVFLILINRAARSAPGVAALRFGVKDTPAGRGDGPLGWWKATLGRIPEPVQDLLRIGLAGILMLILAYPLTFTVRAYAISGRDTRVHVAGVIGAAVLIGAVLLLVLWMTRSWRWRGPLHFMIAAWLGLLAGYGFVVQRDYVLAWQYQRSFWSDLVKLLPDVGEGTSILVDPQGLEDTRQIGANYWNLPRVLEQLYVFPEDWSVPPRAIRMEKGWRENTSVQDGGLVLDATSTYAPASIYGTVSPENTILIEVVDGKPVRDTGPLAIANRSLSLKPMTGTGEPPYPHAFLYQLMIQGGT
jgi:hypothetical protein